jgi:hypothetical protein
MPCKLAPFVSRYLQWLGTMLMSAVPLRGLEPLFLDTPNANALYVAGSSDLQSSHRHDRFPIGRKGVYETNGSGNDDVGRPCDSSRWRRRYIAGVLDWRCWFHVSGNQRTTCLLERAEVIHGF